MIIPNRSNKSSFLFIVQGQRYLMITLESIQETHPRMADSSVYQLIYLGHREWILKASLIQIREINAHSPLPTLFLYYYRVCQPFKIEDLLDSPSLLEFRYLLSDCFCMLFGWTLRKLLFGGY